MSNHEYALRMTLLVSGIFLILMGGYWTHILVDKQKMDLWLGWTYVLIIVVGATMVLGATEGAR